MHDNSSQGDEGIIDFGPVLRVSEVKWDLCSTGAEDRKAGVLESLAALKSREILASGATEDMAKGQIAR